MARKITTKSSPVLPGQSRSTSCPKGKGACHRLAGHKGACRGTLNRTAASLPNKPSVGTFITVVGDDGREVTLRVVEVHSVQPKAASQPKAARRARRPKAVGQCRVVKAGTRCSRAYGHKQAGQRHSFAVVTVLPDATAEGRDVQIVRGKSSRRRNFVASSKPSSRLA